MTIKDRCFSCKNNYFELRNTPFEFMYKPFGWTIQLGFKDNEGGYGGLYTLEINGVKFEEMPEAPPRQRAALARTAM